MTSSYSPDLRLELMATGDQSGTWGDTTNTNLGTLLEQAICGVLSVAEGDTTLTLTALNGAADQARNAVVNLTGAMTGARNVVVPTANKLYLVKNSTTGGFAVTVKTAAGSGVAIAAGTSQWVYCDGTNVVQGLVGGFAPDANNNLSVNNLFNGFTTTATAASTTTLTVASTAIQVFTGSSTQTVVLPTTSIPAGGQYTVVNNSTGAVTVQSSGANTITVLAAGTSGIFTAVVATPTTAANWDAQYLGVVVASGKLLTVSNSVAFTGTDGTSMALPSTSATLARTDAGNTFTGTQIVSGAVTVNGTGTSTVSGPLNLAAATAGQIVFPASQNASANANTLDDYEEGSFTPTFSASGSTFSYVGQSGVYVKIGQLVFFTISLKLATTGNTLAANALSIAGLPFTSAAAGVADCPITWFLSTSSYDLLFGEIVPGATSLLVYGATSASTNVFNNVLANGGLNATSGTQFNVSGCYKASA